MCGIAGFVDASARGRWSARSDAAEAERVRLRAMCSAIRHRGPDDEGMHLEPGVALGMRRLAIIDLATGRHVLEVLGDLNRNLGKTVVIITHNSAIADVAHRVIRLGRGSITELYENENPLPPAEVTW